MQNSSPDNNAPDTIYVSVINGCFKILEELVCLSQAASADSLPVAGSPGESLHCILEKLTFFLRRHRNDDHDERRRAVMELLQMVDCNIRRLISNVRGREPDVPLTYWQRTIEAAFAFIGNEVRWFLVPYPQNKDFVGRASILKDLKESVVSHSRTALYGLAGIGKTQVALEYAYWLQETYPATSVFWVHAGSIDRFRESFLSIAEYCNMLDYLDPNADVVSLVKTRLESAEYGQWLMVLDGADDAHIFASSQGNMQRYIPNCAHGSILVTTRNKIAAIRLCQGNKTIALEKLDPGDSEQFLRAMLEYADLGSDLSELSSRLEFLPLALAQATAFINENTVTAGYYIELFDQDAFGLLSEDFETVGRDLANPNAVAAAFVVSLEQIARQDPLASKLLSDITSEDSSQRATLTNVGNCIEGRKAIGTLKAFSFISGEGDDIFVHPLVRLISRRWYQTP